MLHTSFSGMTIRSTAVKIPTAMQLATTCMLILKKNTNEYANLLPTL